MLKKLTECSKVCDCNASYCEEVHTFMRIQTLPEPADCVSIGISHFRGYKNKWSQNKKQGGSKRSFIISAVYSLSAITGHIMEGDLQTEALQKTDRKKEADIVQKCRQK